VADDWGLIGGDQYEGGPYCEHCEHELEWVDCDQCGGDGMGDHDCGEDCCPCLDPEPNEPCAQCRGAGGWHWCDNHACPRNALAQPGGAQSNAGRVEEADGRTTRDS
jgi:hypothetical protein